MSYDDSPIIVDGYAMFTNPPNQLDRKYASMSRSPSVPYHILGRCAGMFLKLEIILMFLSFTKNGASGYKSTVVTAPH